MNMRNRNWFYLLISIILISCNADYSPKPRGYYRIELPKKTYTHINTECNYSFDMPSYAVLVDDSSSNSKACWKNIIYKGLNGRLHISYYPITSEKMFYELVEDSRKLVFKHTVKADGIDESKIIHKEKNVYGLYYDIGGNSASSVQFFLTDSNKHFLRGALYFYAVPQADSIEPVLNFVKNDIDRMIESFEWSKK